MLTHDQKGRIGFNYIINLIQPASQYGRETLRALRPVKKGQAEALKKEFENIAKTAMLFEQNKEKYEKLEQLFSQTKDIRKTISRIGTQLNEVDLFELKKYLLQLAEITPIFNEINEIAQYNDIGILKTEQALKILDPEKSNVASFHISSRSFPILAKIREEKKEIEKKLRIATNHDEKEALTAQRSELVKSEQKEEQKAAMWLSKKLETWRETLLQNAGVISRLDLTMQKAKLATKYKICVPEISGDTISFTDMTNPQINDILAESNRIFTPLSIELTKGSTVITGANMGGKSVALKTIALNVLLIHYGFYPFASEAKCPILDNICLISDDLEATDRGLSSFGGEIVKLQEILAETTNAQSLIILDEFARGTNPAEGREIAGAVCRYMNKQDAYTAMTTHYEGVSDHAGAHYQVAGLRKLRISDTLIQEMQSMTTKERIAKIAQYMDYGLLKVSPDEKLPEDAVNICKLLGLEQGIMELIKR